MLVTSLASFANENTFVARRRSVAFIDSTAGVLSLVTSLRRHRATVPYTRKYPIHSLILWPCSSHRNSEHRSFPRSVLVTCTRATVSLSCQKEAHLHRSPLKCSLCWQHCLRRWRPSLRRFSPLKCSLCWQHCLRRWRPFRAICSKVDKPKRNFDNYLGTSRPTLAHCQWAERSRQACPWHHLFRSGRESRMPKRSTSSLLTADVQYLLAALPSSLAAFPCHLQQSGKTKAKF